MELSATDKRRAERDRKRIAEDDRVDALLATSEGREAFWSELDAQCRDSALIALLERVLPLDGDIIECGVFRGTSLKMIARSVMDRAPQKTIYACDSYEGFPEDGVGAKDTTFFRPASRLKGKFADASDVPERLMRFFSAYGVTGRIEKGYFADTLPALRDSRFCFLHIDSDTYQSHIECLELLYDRVVSGGIVVFDDYNEPRWPGAKRAIDEFFAPRAEKPALSKERKNSAWFVQKP
jgi:predicted O-methyltransferase YrrM